MSILKKLAFCFVVALLLVRWDTASAVMYLEICGSSTHVCDIPDAADSYGKSVDSVVVIDQPSGDKVEVKPSTDSLGNEIPTPSAPSGAAVIPASTTYTIIGGSPQAVPAGLSDNAYRCDLGGGAVWTSPVPTFECGSNAPGCSATYLVGGSQRVCLFPVSTAPSCPSGYLMSADSCVLVDPNAVTPDANVPYDRVGDHYELTSTGDIDAVNHMINPAQPAPNQLQFVGQNSASQPVIIDVVARADGGSTVTTSTQVSDTSGNTGVSSQVIQISPQSVIESMSQSTSGGSITVAEGTGGSPTTGSITSAPAGALPLGSGGDSLTDCDKSPNDIGCMDAGIPTDTETLGAQSVSVAITPVNFGISATCPADRILQVPLGHTVTLSYASFCSFLNSIRPLVLALAWLGAGYIIISGTKSGAA